MLALVAVLMMCVCVYVRERERESESERERESESLGILKNSTSRNTSEVFYLVETEVTETVVKFFFQHKTDIVKL